MVSPDTPFTHTPFTQGLRRLCLPCATTKPAKSPLKAEGRPNGCFGRLRVAHRTFRHRHGRHGRREVLSMFKTVAQRSPRRSVAHRSLKGGRMKAHTSPWSQNGCTVVGHWSPSKKCEHCVSIWATRLPSLYHHCASFGRPMASIERSLWRPLCLHSATTATLEPPWQWFCLHSAFFARPVVPLQQLWSFEEGTRVVLQQLHRNRTFWVPATTDRPNHFYGRTKVARRSQPCDFGGSRWHKGRAVAVTQKQNFLGLGDHWASWSFCWSLKGGTKVATLCKGGLIAISNCTLCSCKGRRINNDYFTNRQMYYFGETALTAIMEMITTSPLCNVKIPLTRAHFHSNIERH